MLHFLDQMHPFFPVPLQPPEFIFDIGLLTFLGHNEIVN